MRRFIICENIKHYRSLLETTTDEAERKRILTLLAEEEAKSTAIDSPPDKKLRRA